MPPSFKARLVSFLRWTERYTKTDMVYLASGGAWLTLGQITGMVASFLLAVAFANLVPKETFGTYKYILSVAGLLSSFTLSGMGTAVIQSVARGHEAALRDGFRAALRFGLILTAIASLAALYYFLKGNGAFALGLLFIGAFAPFIQAAQLYSAYLNGKKEFKRLALSDASAVIVPAALLATAAFLGAGPLALVAVYFIANTLVLLFLYAVTVRRYRPNDSRDDAVLSYGKHLSVMNILSVAADQIDQILVFHFLGAAKLAVYAFAVAIPEQIKGLFKNVTSLALPKFAAQDAVVELKRSLLHKMVVVSATAAVAVAAYILAAPLIFSFFFPAYSASVVFSQVFALSLLSIGNTIPFSALQARMAQKELYGYNIGIALAQITLFVVLIPLYGVWGAVGARIVARFTGFAAATALALRIREFSSAREPS